MISEECSFIEGDRVRWVGSKRKWTGIVKQVYSGSLWVRCEQDNTLCGLLNHEIEAVFWNERWGKLPSFKERNIIKKEVAKIHKIKFSAKARQMLRKELIKLGYKRIYFTFDNGSGEYEEKWGNKFGTIIISWKSREMG